MEEGKIQEITIKNSMNIKAHNYLTYFIGIVCLIGMTSCSKKVVYNAPVAFSQEYISTLSEEKQIASSFVTASKNDTNFFDSLLSDDFSSYDQYWGGEKEGFMLSRNSDESFSQMKPIRILQDSSLVAVHSRMLGDTLRFRWDILRIEQQQIQEHWSNVNDSIGISPDGHSEIDGPTIPEQLELTDSNRALVKQFVNQCLINEDGGARKFFNLGLYIQHDRNVGDGLIALLFEIIRMKLSGTTLKFEYNYHVIAEGNLVLSTSEGFINGKKIAFYDLFRVEENKLVEHWDIVAPVNSFLDSKR